MEIIVNNFQNIDNNLAMHVLMWSMLFDIATGYAKSVVWKVTDSNVGWKGLIKHALVFSFFLILYPYAEAFGWSQFVTIIAYIYSGNYLLSILENFGVMGIYVPEFLENKVKAEIQRYEELAENLIIKEKKSTNTNIEQAVNTDIMKEMNKKEEKK